MLRPVLAIDHPPAPSLRRQTFHAIDIFPSQTQGRSRTGMSAAAGDGSEYIYSPAVDTLVANYATQTSELNALLYETLLARQQIGGLDQPEQRVGTKWKRNASPLEQP